MKSQRGEGTKLNQGKGVVASGDREPLFPRLHVNETEKQGPKAPPRNKMALYEQFTVPSHHFQPAQGSASTVLVQPNASGYPYIPYCFPSVAYGNANNVQAYTQPSQVTSSSDITIRSTVVNEESQKAPRHKKLGNVSPGKVLRGFMETSSECIASNPELQRGNFKVSMAKAIGDYTSFRGNVPMCKERPDTSTKTESSNDVVSTLKGTMDSLHQRINCAKKNEIRKLESGNLFSRLELSEGTSKTQASSVSVKSQTEVSGSENDSIAQSFRHDEHYTDPCQKYAECKSSEKNDSPPDLVDKLRSSVEDNPGLVSNERLKIKNSSSVHTNSPGVRMAKQVNSNFKDFEELKTEDNMPGVSHDAGNGTHDSSDDSVLSLKPKGGHHDSSDDWMPSLKPKGGHHDGSDDWMPSLKPKDVILAIGQQQFWKARKMLLRQQRIFSDQVFQLHKLIMTQQLLAQTPGTLIDEASHFETLEEWNNTPDPPAEGTVNLNCSARNEGCSSKESKVQKYDAEGFKPLSKGVEKDEEMGMLESTHGGISAWGYPSLGQWLGPGVQGQPYGYPPLSGAFPLGLPYGSTVSFGIPFCGQQQEIPAEMGSNYGPASVSKLEPSGVKRGNFGLFSNFANSWYVMQHNSLNQHRMHYGVPGKDAPTGSGASVNKASLSAGLGGRKSCFPGLLRHRSINSQPRDIPNTEGLDSSGPHSEISSPSIATKLACSSTPLTPSIPMTKKKGLKEGPATGHRYVTGSLNRSYSFDSRRLGDEEEADARVSSKALKEGCSIPINDASAENSLGMGGRALELFPLVPSLSVSDQIREQESRVLEMGQGSLIRAVPRRAVAASESTAGILLSLQEERRK